MRIKKCPVVSNHFYNAEDYSSCPHCAKAAGTEPAKILINNGKNNNIDHKAADDKSNEKVQSKGIKDIFAKRKNEKKGERTHSFWPDIDDTEEENNEEISGKSSEEMIQESSSIKAENNLVQNEIITSNDEENDSIESSHSKFDIPSVSQQINKVAMSGNINDLKTVAYYGFNDDIEPVVGWLVLLNTEDKGSSFELKCGRNTIGRSGSGIIVDISLEKDTSISRGIQAIIIYEPRKRIFLIKSNDSNTLVYVNDDLLLEHKVLNIYDRISLGNSEMMFMPLCSDKFSWDE